VSAEYDLPHEFIMAITVKVGAAVVYEQKWDFTNGALMLPFPVAIRGSLGVAVSAELEASGVPGTSGRVSLWGFSD